MEEQSESMRMVEWFQSLSFSERREKIRSMREFFTKNTSDLLRTVKRLESCRECPPDLIRNAKELVANNMGIMNTLEKIEKGVEDAEKKIGDEAVESGSTAAGE